MSMRYQHKEDENGNHLVVGREGQLTRCEDEVFFHCYLLGGEGTKGCYNSAYSYPWRCSGIWCSHRCR
jgi:hypothetical protein